MNHFNNASKAVLIASTLLTTPIAHSDEFIMPVQSVYQGDNTDRYNKNTVGAGMSYETIYDNWSVSGGMFRNDRERQSNWLAMSYKAQIVKIFRVGADFGIMSGFGKKRPGATNGILPAIIPSIGVRSKKGFGADVVALPAVGVEQDWMVQFRLIAPL